MLTLTNNIIKALAAELYSSSHSFWYELVMLDLSSSGFNLVVVGD
jgi:hypothetical protein